MKKFLSLVFTATLLMSNLAQADCLPSYNDKIKILDGKMQSFKTTLITSAASEAALVGSIFLIAGSVNPVGVVAIPASMVGVGSYYGAIAIEKKTFTEAAKLIKEAKLGKGKRLAKVSEQINIKLGLDLTQATIAQAITTANDNNEFCELNERTEKVKLMGYLTMVKFLKEEARAGL